MGGNDTLLSGDGNDIIDSGADGDRLFGEVGADTFVLRAGDGRDIIYDYQDGVDAIGLGGGLAFGDLTVSALNARLAQILVTSTSESLALLSNVNAANLDASDFVAV